MAGNYNSGRQSNETPEEAFTSGRHYEAMRIARIALADARLTDQRPEAANTQKAG